MMALEQQQPDGRSSRLNPNRRNIHTSTATISKTTDPLPIPPPPSHRKSPTRCALTRRSSTPCHVVTPSPLSAKISMSKPSTPTSNNLSLCRSKQSNLLIKAVDFENILHDSDNNADVKFSSTSKGLSKTTSSGSLCPISNKVLTSNKLESHNSVLFSINPQSVTQDNNNYISSVNQRHRHISPIRLDPPPTRKSKSQSPARSKVATNYIAPKQVSQCNSPQNTHKSIIHPPVHISRSAPSNKNKDVACPPRSPIKTSTLLNGFVSTPPTPTVTITPTSSPPLQVFSDNVLDFGRENTRDKLTKCTTFHSETNDSKSPSHRITSPSRQIGIGGFEGKKNRLTEKWVENPTTIPSPPTKPRPTVNLLDLKDSVSTNRPHSQISSHLTPDGSTSDTALLLPDPPDLVYSGASSSEGAESPFNLPASPMEEADSRLHPGATKIFNWFDPSDLSVDEFRDFAMKWGSPHHAPSSHTMLLTIPPPSVLTRPRVTSLPAPPCQEKTDENEEYYRLRHFSIIGKGIVNRGDSMKTRRSKSNACALESLKVSE